MNLSIHFEPEKPYRTCNQPTGFIPQLQMDNHESHVPNSQHPWCVWDKPQIQLTFCCINCEK
ncbi:hypothetical protein V6Z12_D02G132400 [Gossypium hirsutum]